MTSPPPAALFDVTFLAVLAVALAATGALAGLLAGLLGVGGGIVIVPVLYHVFTELGIDEAVRMHVAVGTSLATIVPTAVVSARSHRRRGAVDGDLLRTWGPAILVGVLVGTVAGGAVKGPVLTGVFAVVALLVAAHMAFAPEGRVLAARLPGPGVGMPLAAAIGGISVMMGIGGGTLSVPILTTFSYPMRRAVGTASAIGLIIGIPGAIGFAWSGLGVADRPPWSLGYVNLLGFVLLVPMTMLAAPWGARLAHTINPRLLRRVFSFFLFLTAMRMMYGLYPRG
ncbi:MAG: sulfite exporter TauE/SafE family protein [Alphaproteobacteria bacterium]